VSVALPPVPASAAVPAGLGLVLPLWLPDRSPGGPVPHGFWGRASCLVSWHRLPGGCPAQAGV